MAFLAMIIATLMLLACGGAQARLLRGPAVALPGPNTEAAARRSLMGELAETKTDAPALDAAWSSRELPRPREVRVSSGRAGAPVYGYQATAVEAGRMNGPIQMDAWQRTGAAASAGVDYSTMLGSSRG
jgi:hypothetical protein